MQMLSWYVARLSAMPPQEISWRVRTSLRNRLDYIAAPLRRRKRPFAALLAADHRSAEPAFRVCDLDVGAWANGQATEREREWCRRLTERADRIASGRLSFFDLEDCDLGNPIDWNRDHKSNRAGPMGFSPAIDYRDFRVTGDCKFVWEPNRHHQLTVLGRAYRASGDRRYAVAATAQLESWLEQCPFGLGMNWRSPLELAIRLINWVWTYDLIREADVVSESLRARWLQAIYMHLWEIARNYSRGSSAGNHRIGEAAGVYIASSYLPFLKNTDRWRRESREILNEEIVRQTYADGGPCEQAIGYHLFILQFFLIAAITARRTGDDFPRAYWARLERMFGFVAALQAGGERLPMFGDSDDGYVLDLGDGQPDGRALLAIGDALCGRGASGTMSDRDMEPACWLLGRDLNRCDASPAAVPPNPIRSLAFEDTGYYLLQCGTASRDDRISVVFDCGPLGLSPLAGHGHADALSFTLRAFGKDVFVDPGTYDYFSHPTWRPYFRGTGAHNTIVIDGQDQSEMCGSFLWGRRADARCVDWEPTDRGGTVVGQHDGYTRLAQPVVHRRTLTLDGDKREIVITDDLFGKGTHTATVNFHCAEHCRVLKKGAHCFEADVGAGIVTLELDRRLSVRELRGSEEPLGGWVSRGYHRKTPATHLVGDVTLQDSISLMHRISIGRPR